MTFGYGTISQFRAFSWFQGVQPSVRISLGVHDLPSRGRDRMFSSPYLCASSELRPVPRLSLAPVPNNEISSQHGHDADSAKLGPAASH